MSDEQPETSNTSQYKPIIYKPGKCMARDCENDATHVVILVLVNKSGDFCESCTRYFEERNLMVSCCAIDDERLLEE